MIFVFLFVENSYLCDVYLCNVFDYETRDKIR